MRGKVKGRVGLEEKGMGKRKKRRGKGGEEEKKEGRGNRRREEQKIDLKRIVKEEWEGMVRRGGEEEDWEGGDDWKGRERGRNIGKRKGEEEE